MSKFTRAGAAALVAGPLIGLIAVIVVPTMSDDSSDIVSALTAHHAAMIASFVLEPLAVSLLMAGVVWLAAGLWPHSPRLATTGGILAVAGGLVILFEDGVSAATASIVSSLDPTRAGTAVHQLTSSAAVRIEPLGLVLDLGLALIAFAAVRAGAQRWLAPALTVAAFAQGIGFGAAARPLVIIGFAGLSVTFALIVRGAAATQSWSPAREAVGVA